MLRWKSSAVAWYSCARAVSAWREAMAEAAVSPAISAAIVDGENPACSSQRSTPEDGPLATRKSAAGRMWLCHNVVSPPSPARLRHQDRIGGFVQLSPARVRGQLAVQK